MKYESKLIKTFKIVSIKFTTVIFQPTEQNEHKQAPLHAFILGLKHRHC